MKFLATQFECFAKGRVDFIDHVTWVQLKFDQPMRIQLSLFEFWKIFEFRAFERPRCKWPLGGPAV